MVIFRSPGSLSRCDATPYSDMYDVHKRGKLKNVDVIAPPPIHKDSIEISKDKLKKDALNRLRHISKYTIAHNGFMRIGKYLFLAITLPPFLIIYGLPKWVVVEGVPAFFSTSLWMWKKIQRQSQKQVEAGIRKVIQMAVFVQRVTQVLMQPVIQLVLQIRQGGRHLRDHAFRIFKNTTARIKFTQRLRRLNVVAAFKQINKRTLKARQRFSKSLEALNLHVQQGVHWIKESSQTFLGWGQCQFQSLKRYAFTLNLQWKHRFSSPQQKADKATRWILNQFEKISVVLKKPFLVSFDFFQERWHPRWRVLKDGFKGKWQQAEIFFQNQHQRALVFIHKRQRKLKAVSSPRVLEYLLSRQWMRRFPMHFQEGVKKCLCHPIVKAAITGGVKIYLFFAHIFWSFLKHILQLMAHASASVIKGCNVLWKAAMTLVRDVIFNVLKNCGRLFQKYSVYALYYFLLFSIIAFILLMWGIRLLGDNTNAFISNFSLKSKKISA